MIAVPVIDQTGPPRVTFGVHGAAPRRLPRVALSGALGGATGPTRVTLRGALGSVRIPPPPFVMRQKLTSGVRIDRVAAGLRNFLHVQ